MRTIVVAIIGVACALVLTACEGAAPQLPPAGPNAKAITVESSPSGATVLVDGMAIGPAPQTVKLNPGPHRLKVTMSGYYPAEDKRIIVGDDQPLAHTFTLVPSH